MSILSVKEETSDCSSIWSHLELLLLLSAQTDSYLLLILKLNSRNVIYCNDNIINCLKKWVKSHCTIVGTFIKVSEMLKCYIAFCHATLLSVEQVT